MRSAPFVNSKPNLRTNSQQHNKIIHYLTCTFKLPSCIFESKFFVFRFYSISFLSSPKPSSAMSWSLFIFFFFNLFFFFTRTSRLGHVWLVPSFSVWWNDCGDRVGQTRFVWCSLSACRGRKGKRKRAKLVRIRMDGRRCEESLPKLIGNIYVTNYLWCDDPHNDNNTETRYGRHGICPSMYAWPEKANGVDKLVCSLWVLGKFMHQICDQKGTWLRPKNPGPNVQRNEQLQE